ncbi:MAG: protein kinase, partial [Gemmatimonadaceae bacterium]
MSSVSDSSNMTDDAVARLAAALAGTYRIERKLGEGGMATVYLAEDLRHQRKVAVKVVHPELAAVLGAERFLSEIHVTAALQHPHILPLFDSGQADGQLYYVMPFVDGESLRGRLHRERQLPIDEAVRLSREVASALDYAHRKGVIHRDIKPENILVHDGQAVVADFGIALAVTNAGGGRITQTGLSLGTPQYMSPEQATGERDIDARSDVYSLGAVTYEMLTGEAPFTGPTAQAIVAKVITTEPPRLVPQRKLIPQHVEAAVLKALEKMPADRFLSAAEFSRALGDTAFETTRVKRSASGPLTVDARRWKVATLTATTVAVILSGILAWKSTRSARPLPVSRHSVVLEGNNIGNGTDAPGVSPDGQTIIYTSEEGRLLARDRNEFKARPVEGAEQGWAPFFSNDAAMLGFFTGYPGSLKIAPMAGGSPTTLFDSAYANGGSWSDDGWIYFNGNSAGRITLLRIRASGGKPEVVARPDSARDELFFFWPEALAGGRTVLATIWRQKGAPDIAAIDVKTGKHRELGKGIRALSYGSGYLAILQGDGTVTASRFDERRAELQGKPVTMISGVHVGGQGRPAIGMSREGTLLYEAYTPLNRIVRVTREGAVSAVDPDWTGSFINAQVSPDGRRIAVATELNSRTEVWVKDLSSGTFTRLAGDGTYSYRCVWTPDGKGVSFTTDRPGRPTVFTVAADGGSPPRLTMQDPRGVDESAWSRDGKWLVYRIGSGGNRDIHVRGASDSTGRALIHSESEEFSPTLSPDGRWIAFGTEESGRTEIYVRPFPDVERTKWQVSKAGGSEPVWSADGRELFYRSSKGDLVAAQIDASSDFRVSDERLLFPAGAYKADNRHRAFSVSPDARSFYFIQELPGTRSQIIVVTNWWEELKAK